MLVDTNEKIGFDLTTTLSFSENIELKRV